MEKNVMKYKIGNSEIKTFLFRTEKTNRHQSFTLVELVTAMSVFTVIMLVMMSFFTAAQEAWTDSNARSMVYDNAKLAMDLITRDLQCAAYEENKIPFWCAWPNDPTSPDAAWEEHRNGVLAFVSATTCPPNTLCSSNLFEIKYQKYYYDIQIV